MATIQVSFKLTKNEKKTFAEYHQRRGRSITGWVRAKVLTEIDRIAAEQNSRRDPYHFEDDVMEAESRVNLSKEDNDAREED